LSRKWFTEDENDKKVTLFAVASILFGCGQQEQPRVIVDVMDRRPVIITKDGQLLFESKPMTRDELVKMVKERVEKDRLSQVPSQHSTILLEPDPETPYKKFREIEDLIMENDGRPGIKKAHPASGGDSSTLANAGLDQP
jgi:hypothetical protein